MTRKLSKQQQDRIQQRRAAAAEDHANALTGTVLSRSKKQALIETNQGQKVLCHLRQHLTDLCAGDQILWETVDDHGVIVDIQPRQNILSQPAGHNKTKAIAANIDYLIIVSALEPHWSDDLIDSLILAAELHHMTPIIVVNKIDLIDDQLEEQVDHDFTIYKALGYQTFFTSALSGFGVNDFANFIVDNTSVLVGQSGVGKSSLTNCLIPDLEQQTKTLTPAGLGSHTTSNATRFCLPQGGALIDAPGIREFKLSHMSLEDIESGFKDFKPFLGDCKFHNCMHDKEPKCAIRDAVTQGKITPSRYQSFLSLCQSYLL